VGSLEIDYEGWFQCRLATDPDPFAEPRGRHGWTFAFHSEPDLDRFIRLQNPVAPRVEGPTVGVHVNAVRLNGAVVAATPLLGAQVELIDGAVFAGENGRIAPSAQEPINPWHIRIDTAGGLVLSRHDPLNLNDPADVARRQPVYIGGDDPEVRAATSVTDYAAYRRDRRDALRTRRENSGNPDERQLLQERITELEQGLDSPDGDIRFRILGFRVDWEHDLTGAAVVNDPGNELPSTPQAGMAWHIRHWMGGWDADALCGYTRGTLTIPVH
jgi:hypothetical protein